MTAGNGKVVFVPRNAGGVGVFDPTTDMFSVVDISGSISGVDRFDGGATAGDGRVVFVPWESFTAGVGVFDPKTDTFKLFDIVDKITINEKFNGTALAGNGRVVFAPYYVHAVGVFDPADDSFTFVEIPSGMFGSTEIYSTAPLMRATARLCSPLGKPPALVCFAFLSPSVRAARRR